MATTYTIDQLLSGEVFEDKRFTTVMRSDGTIFELNRDYSGAISCSEWYVDTNIMIMSDAEINIWLEIDEKNDELESIFNDLDQSTIDKIYEDAGGYESDYEVYIGKLLKLAREARQ